MPIYETGHARNIQNFQTLISFVTAYGAAYDPTNPDLAVANLTGRLTAANGAMDDVASTLAANKSAINARETAFAPLRKLVTRVVNFYASTGAAANKIDDAKTFKRKIDGVRAEPLVDDPNTPEDESQGGISASQQSYTQLVEHFEGLIALLLTDPLYNPNEPDLQIAALEALATSLKANNTAVISVAPALSTNRILRDNILYAEGTGIVELALLVKKYVKALFGASSPQYGQIRGLKFTRPNGS